MIRNTIILLITIIMAGCVTVDEPSILMLAERTRKLEVESKILVEKTRNLETQVKTLTENIAKRPKEQIVMTMAPPEEKIVWITLSNDSSIPIKLTLKDNRWIGPKGEYYNTLPSERTLKKLYDF